MAFHTGHPLSEEVVDLHLLVVIAFVAGYSLV